MIFKIHVHIVIQKRWGPVVNKIEDELQLTNDYYYYYGPLPVHGTVAGSATHNTGMVGGTCVLI